jgi:hypothetical protein
MSEDAGYAERFLCAPLATVTRPISDLRLLISGLFPLPFALSLVVLARAESDSVRQKVYYELALPRLPRGRSMRIWSPTISPSLSEIRSLDLGRPPLA